eukprot:14933511-Alexandrium_andersonii.AAC.1
MRGTSWMRQSAAHVGHGAHRGTRRLACDSGGSLSTAGSHTDTGMWPCSCITTPPPSVRSNSKVGVVGNGAQVHTCAGGTAERASGES